MARVSLRRRMPHAVVSSCSEKNEPTIGDVGWRLVLGYGYETIENCFYDSVLLALC